MTEENNVLKIVSCNIKNDDGATTSYSFLVPVKDLFNLTQDPKLTENNTLSALQKLKTAKLVALHTCDANGELQGEYISSHSNGELNEKGSYKNGGMSGVWESYHNNGKLKDKGPYKNDMLNGVWESYHDNENLEEKGSYKNDIVEGEWEYHYRNGDLKSKGVYKDGKKHGIWLVGDEPHAVYTVGPQYIFYENDKAGLSASTKDELEELIAKQKLSQVGFEISNFTP